MTIESVAVVAGASIAAVGQIVAQSVVSPDALHVVATAGLGGVLSWILLKHFIAEQNRAMSRLAKVEDTTMQFAERMAQTVTEFTCQVKALVAASNDRGKEVRILLARLAQRPCLREELERQANETYHEEQTPPVDGGCCGGAV